MLLSLLRGLQLARGCLLFQYLLSSLLPVRVWFSTKNMGRAVNLRGTYK